LEKEELMDGGDHSGGEWTGGKGKLLKIDV